MKTIYITMLVSKAGNNFLALVADIGYKRLIITTDRAVIYEISPVAPCVLNALNPDDKVEIV